MKNVIKKMFFPVLAISIMIAYTACSNDESSDSGTKSFN